MGTSVRKLEKVDGIGYRVLVQGDLLQGGACLAQQASELPEQLPPKLKKAITELFSKHLVSVQITSDGKRIDFRLRDMRDEGRMRFTTELAKLAGRPIGHRRPRDINLIQTSLIHSLNNLLS